MSEVPKDLLYSEEYEYVKSTDAEGEYLVGVTDYAQGELGDVVFLELPEVGSNYNRMDVFGTIEAVKAVSDLYAPVTGEIVAVNSALDDDPSLVNTDPYGEGWMIRVRVADASALEGLLDAEGYSGHIGD